MLNQLKKPAQIFLLLCICFVGMACKNKKDPPYQGALILVQPFQFNAPSQRLLMGTGLSIHKLKKQLHQKLASSKAVKLLPKGTKDSRAYAAEFIVGVRRLPLRRLSAKRIEAAVQLYISCQLSPQKSKRETIVVEERQTIRYGRRRPSSLRLQKTVRTLWKKMGRSLQIFATLRTMTSDKIRTKLLHADTITQRHGAFLLGRRKDRSSLSVLLQLMKSKDEQVLIATIGALVRLKDPRAAVPLINSVNHHGNIYTTQIISALVELGGDVAKSYLFTLEVGHPNKQIQQTAREGLQELQKPKVKKN